MYGVKIIIYYLYNRPQPRYHTHLIDNFQDLDVDISEYDFGSPRPQTPIQSFFKSQSKTQVSSKKVIFSNLLHIFLVLLGRDLHRHHKRKVSWNNKIARKQREQS